MDQREVLRAEIAAGETFDAIAGGKLAADMPPDRTERLVRP